MSRPHHAGDAASLLELDLSTIKERAFFGRI